MKRIDKWWEDPDWDGSELFEEDEDEFESYYQGRSREQVKRHNDSFLWFCVVAAGSLSSYVMLRLITEFLRWLFKSIETLW